MEVAVRVLLRIPVALPLVLALPLALAVAVLWGWAVVRLAVAPAEAGPVEGAIAVGGWGLGLLPVHCVPGPVRGLRRGDPGGAGRDAGGASGRSPGVPGGVSGGAGVTTASRPRRSAEGSGPS
ncbi:hypothetical protein ABZ716_07820 [Streptomyces sp. NPDC006687]|uniref:hypothetical protein n=1 Tax=unclassified Streptomyces TaxID=2593676 RepID=UPI0033FB1383